MPNRFRHLASSFDWHTDVSTAPEGGASVVVTCTSVMQGMFGASLSLHKIFAMHMCIIPCRHDSLCWVV